MSSNDKAAEVAEDYREALQDLTMNSRFEISNLTVVARENTEHALAIAETLQDHIKKVGKSSLLKCHLSRRWPTVYLSHTLDSLFVIFHAHNEDTD